MIMVGISDNCSQLVETTPIKKPSKLKVNAVKTNIKIITIGWAMEISTKTLAVPKINTPKIIDFDVAAPTNPITISQEDKGAA